jgi:type IV secretory pathway VirB2 component (pilin)
MLFPGFAQQIQHMASGGFAGVIAVLLIAETAAVYFIGRN